MERIGVDLTPPPDNGGAMLSDIVLEGMNRSTKAGKRESTKVAEQLRRNKMRQLYRNLESLIPTPFPKGDRCKLMEEAENYVKKLQVQIHQLNQQKDHLNGVKKFGKIVNQDTNFIEVNVEVGTKDATIIIYGSRKLRYLWKIVEEVEGYGLDVDISQLSTSKSFVYIYIHANFIEDMKEHDLVQLQSSLKNKLLMVY